MVLGLVGLFGWYFLTNGSNSDAGGDSSSSAVFEAARDNAQERECAANQRTVIGATAQWLASDPANLPEDVSMEILVGPDAYIKDYPECPSGGVYELGDDAYVCSVHGDLVNQ